MGDKAMRVIESTEISTGMKTSGDFDARSRDPPDVTPVTEIMVESAFNSKLSYLQIAITAPLLLRESGNRMCRQAGSDRRVAGGIPIPLHV
jgi:hypothetical protein